MNLSQDVRDRLFISSIEIIEYSRVLEDEATTKHWGWLFHTYIQWHAIAFVLGELGEREDSTTTERAWRAMHGVFDAWGGTVVLQKRHMLWQPMRQLMAKAKRKREQNRQNLRDGELNADNHYTQAQAQATTYNTAPENRADANMLLPLNHEQLYTPMQQNTQMYAINNTPVMEPQVLGMGALAPEQVQLQLQHQQLSLPQWSMDDSFLDIDMAGLENVPDWNGWNDMVRDYQLEADAQSNNAGRGAAIGGMGNWW